MYDIDFMTATARDIIRRSVICHPTMLAESCAAAARVHSEAIETLGDKRSIDVARCMVADLSRACAVLPKFEPGQALDSIMSRGMGGWIPVLNCALKLQCVPRSLWGDIAAREA